MSDDRSTVLRAESLTVRYGGVHANNDVSIDVGPGEIVGLIGPNGAGKTTFVDAVTGFTTSTGRVQVDGIEVNGMSPHRRRAHGLARTWQAGELFAELTVAENLMVASRRVGLRTLLDDLIRPRHPRSDAVDRALELVRLGDVADRRPTELALGQQKLVGVARALVGEPHVVLLDEPAAGLDTHESLQFGDEVRRIAELGIGVLLIDHDVTLVLAVCHRLYVMNFGSIIAAGTPDHIRQHPEVIEAYLGHAGAEGAAT
ncbi:MAG: ABC transporter ATP-binding protein [Ilumatobacteraceae bacterium]